MVLAPINLDNPLWTPFRHLRRGGRKPELLEMWSGRAGADKGRDRKSGKGVGNGV